MKRLDARHRALAAVSASHAGLHMYQTSLPLLYPLVLADFRVSYTTLGLLLTVSGAVGAVAQFLSGHLPRGLPRRTILAAGLAITALAALLGSAASSFAMFAVSRFVGQVGQGPQHILANSLIAQLFDRTGRGQAFAVHFSAGNLGGLLVPLLVLPAIAAVGWRGGLALLALPVALMVVVLLVGVREPGVPVVADDPRRKPGFRGSATRSFAPLWRRRSGPLIAAGAIAAGGRGNGIILIFVPLLLRDHFGLSIGEVGLLYTLLVLASIVGPLVVGRSADRTDRRLVILSTLSLAATATLAMLFLGPSLPVLIVSTLVMGAAAFGNGSQLQALIVDQAASDEEARAAFAMWSLVVHLVGGLWPLLLAVIIEVAGFVPAFSLIAASYLAAAAVLVLARLGPGAHAGERAVATMPLDPDP